MATRKRKASSPAVAPDINDDHNCVQCGVIGEINGRLDAQEDTDSRIESSLQQLIANHNEERRQTSKDFTDLKCEITRVGTALETSVKNQTEMIAQMKDLTSTTAAMQQLQLDTQKLFEQHIHESDAWRANIERRVGKLERTKWFWYTLSGIAIGLAGFLSYAASIYEAIVKK